MSRNLASHHRPHLRVSGQWYPALRLWSLVSVGGGSALSRSIWQRLRQPYPRLLAAWQSPVRRFTLSSSPPCPPSNTICNAGFDGSDTLLEVLPAKCSWRHRPGAAFTLHIFHDLFLVTVVPPGWHTLGEVSLRRNDDFIYDLGITIDRRFKQSVNHAQAFERAPTKLLMMGIIHDVNGRNFHYFILTTSQGSILVTKYFLNARLFRFVLSDKKRCKKAQFTFFRTCKIEKHTQTI